VFTAGETRREGTSLRTLTATVKHTLPWRKEPYCVTLHLPQTLAASVGPQGLLDFKCAPLPPPSPPAALVSQ
jgi:hypothetical protein